MLITSSTNSLYKKFLSLTESKGLKNEGLFLLSGKQLVQEFLRHPPLTVESEIFCEGQTPQLELKKQVQLSKDLFKVLDVLGTHSPILAVKQPEITAWNSNSPAKGLTLLTPLGDPSNLGALIRSAEAFGVVKIVLLKEAANPFLPKSVKASAGSVTRVRMEKGPSIHDLENLEVSGSFVALEMKGRSLSGFQWPEESLLIVGEEGAGLPNLSRLQTISVPTQKVESLNATVAASIALYDFSQKSAASIKKVF
jgi:TrmH family RNA methyltransferase